jgi:hypothetical protein
LLHKDSKRIILKSGKVQIFGNDTKKSHMQAQRNLQPIKFGENQLQMGSKSTVFSFATNNTEIEI